jgi:hypothetical protein
LGDGTTVDRSSPVKIGTDLFTAIVPDNERTFALKTDGTLWAWGGNGLGALGDGTTTSRLAPVQIGTDANWAAISTGDSHSVALKKDGTLWTWGYNYYGQLGDSTSYYRPEPAQIGTDTTWAAVAAGDNHSIAMKADGTVWAWGYNYNGELGDGTSANASSPVQVQMAPVMGSQNAFVINGGRRFANNVNVDLYLTASDANGIAEMQFSNDGLTWSSPESYTTSKAWTLETGNGKKTVYVRVKDHAENWSVAQSASIWLEPAVTITSPAAGALVNSSTPVLLYTVSGGTVVVKVDGVTVNKTSGNTLGPLTDGPHTVRVEATNAAGITGFAEVMFTVAVPPTVSIASPAAGYTNNTTPLLTYTVSNGSVVVKVDGAVVNKVSGSNLDPLVDGSHTVRVEATDAGGTGFAERTFAVDTVTPAVVISSPTATTITDNQPLLTYSVTEGTVTVKVDGVIVSKVSGNRLATLSNGTHTVRVEARDAAGNIGFAEVTFIVAAVSGFFDDLESGTAKWESATGLWHVVNGTSPYPNSHSLSHSWWYGQDATGNYNTGVNSGEIVSMPFIVPSNAKLTFWSWEMTESAGTTYDTRKVYLSTNNGSTWTQIFQSTDNTATWHQVTVDLAAYAGMSAKLKFAFNSVDGMANTYRGWYFDDISVATGPGGSTKNEGFETGNLTYLPWITSGNGLWSAKTTTKHGGTYAAEAPVSIVDNQSASLEVTQNCAAGNITFWYSVSSEANWDYLKFYVDGVQKGQWSGTVSWAQASYAVTAGSHTFKWVYSKDGSVSAGSDTAWIDDISIPIP